MRSSHEARIGLHRTEIVVHDDGDPPVVLRRVETSVDIVQDDEARRVNGEGGRVTTGVTTAAVVPRWSPL